ncbi:hypothetical protein [Gracilibacillus sp. YIM 98692]|uniref:hypothetical protein n=1 Tax=Gracilibacillus sp. YIM 98692 TaxID=2663532 RepID=UPI0013D5259A|nr:hypothetical protein [Gracilibacillus sp. YIM 98692]
MELSGKIISGHFDQPNNEFSLQRVKHFYTESTLKKSQIDSLYEYLDKHKHQDDGQIITLYDQLPFHLSQEEVMELIGDLNEIKSLYH